MGVLDTKNTQGEHIEKKIIERKLIETNFLMKN